MYIFFAMVHLEWLHRFATFTFFFHFYTQWFEIRSKDALAFLFLYSFVCVFTKYFLASHVIVI